LNDNENVYLLRSTQHVVPDADSETTEVENGGLVTKQSAAFAVKEGNIAQFQFYTYTEAESHTVTYNFILDSDENITGTTTATCVVNSALPVPTIPAFSTVKSITIGDESFTSFEGISKTVTEDVTVNITLSQTLPFTPGVFYFLNVRPGVAPTWAYYDETNNRAQTKSESDLSVCKNALWKLDRVSGTVDQFTIYNAGQQKYLNGASLAASSTSYTLKSAADNASESNRSGLPAGKTGFEFVLTATPTSVLGTHGGPTGNYKNSSNTSINDIFSNWSSGQLDDAGSIFWTASLSEVFNETKSELTTATGTFTVSDDVANALPEGGATLEEVESFFNSALNWANRKDAENALYRITCPNQSSKAYTVSGYANASGTIDDFADESSTDESTRLVNQQVKDANSFSQLWLLTPYDETSYFVIQSPNSNGYGLGTPGGTTSSYTAHITASTEWSAHINPVSNDANGKYVLEIADQSDLGNEKYFNSTSASNGAICRWKDGFSDLNNIVYIERVAEVSVTLNSDGFATFCAPVAVTIPDGVTAYTAQAVYTQGDVQYAYITELSGVIPANTGVLLQGTASTAYTFAFTANPNAEAAEAEATAFTGITIKRQGLTAGNFLTLNGTDDDSNAKFTTSEETTVAANTAILTLATETIASTKEMPTDGISEISSAAEAASPVLFYNLDGKLAAKPSHGIYVTSDGRKVYVK
jgi:hypothetical protein